MDANMRPPRSAESNSMDRGETATASRRLHRSTVRQGYSRVPAVTPDRATELACSAGVEPFPPTPVMASSRPRIAAVMIAGTALVACGGARRRGRTTPSGSAARSKSIRRRCSLPTSRRPPRSPRSSSCTTRSANSPRWPSRPTGTSSCSTTKRRARSSPATTRRSRRRPRRRTSRSSRLPRSNSG